MQNNGEGLRGIEIKCPLRMDEIVFEKWSDPHLSEWNLRKTLKLKQNSIFLKYLCTNLFHYTIFSSVIIL